MKPLVADNGTLSITRAPIPELANWADTLRLIAAFTENPPVSSKLPFRYQKIPPAFRSMLASAIGSVKRASVHTWARFPGWPLDLSADFLADLTGMHTNSFFDSRCPVLLTHDIDSLEGLQNLVRTFLAIEESVGARSTNFVVPCSWPLDHSLLEAIRERGHEVGVHGYDHNNRTPFASDSERLQRIEAAIPLIEKYDCKGYRAPSLLRTRSLLRVLKSYYQYDSSVPTSGGPFPVPNNGCASARPFLVEGIPEIPLSMPRDGSLLFLRYSSAEILKIWISSADKIARAGGVVTLLTHLENRFSGRASMQEVYRKFIDYIANSDRFRFSTPQEVLRQCSFAGQS